MSLSSWNSLSSSISTSSSSGSNPLAPPLCSENWLPKRSVYSARRVLLAEKALLEKERRSFQVYGVTPAIGCDRLRKSREDQAHSTPDPKLGMNTSNEGDSMMHTSSDAEFVGVDSDDFSSSGINGSSRIRATSIDASTDQEDADQSTMSRAGADDSQAEADYSHQNESDSWFSSEPPRAFVEQLQQLMELGFSQEDATQALIDHGGDIEAAANSLCT